MLAVFFMASTVYAGGNWWSHSLEKFWYKVGKLEKKVAKVENRSKWNSREIKKLKKKPWRKGHNSEPVPTSTQAVDLEALKAEIMDAMKADEAFKAELQGETGPQGPAGPDRARICGGCNLSGEKVWFVGYDFTDAYLNYAQFRGTDLSAATFIDADCKGAWFVQSVVKDANFDGADLTDAYLGDTDWTGVNLATALSVSGAKWVDKAYNSNVRGYEYFYATCPDGSSASEHLKDLSDPMSGTCEGYLTP